MPFFDLFRWLYSVIWNIFLLVMMQKPDLTHIVPEPTLRQRNVADSVEDADIDTKDAEIDDVTLVIDPAFLFLFVLMLFELSDDDETCFVCTNAALQGCEVDICNSTITDNGSCGSGTFTETIAVSPSLKSSPEILNFNFLKNPLSSPYCLNTLFTALLKPLT